MIDNEEEVDDDEFEEDDYYDDEDEDGAEEEKKAEPMVFNPAIHMGSFDEVVAFEKAEAQVESVYEELGNVAKKKPDDPVNKFKLKFVNQVLGNANAILKDTYRPLEDFTVFDEADLPTASDIVFILSQYIHAMDRFRRDHTHVNVGSFYWNLIGETKRVPAKKPKKFDR